MLNAFCGDDAEHEVRPQQPADFQPGVIGRNCSKRKVMGVNRQLSLGLYDGKQHAGGSRVHFLDLNPLMLRNAFKNRDRHIELPAQMSAEKCKDGLYFLWIADMHTAAF